MGACFDGFTTGAEDKKEVERVFEEKRSEAACENGNSYSGRINMAHGLKFLNKEFESVDQAYSYLDDEAEKWGPALAVKVAGKKGWVIGACCSS